VGRDITKLKLAQEWLVTLNEFREAVIHNAHILIAVMDRSGAIYIWNRAAEEITGYPASEVGGNRTVWKFLYPEREYRRSVTEKIRRSIDEKGSFENLETTIRTRNGAHRIISWNTQEIPSRDGTRIIAVGWDVTDQKEAELALVSYMSEAAMRLKNPVEIIEDNLNDICALIRGQQIGIEDILSLLEIQARSAGRIVENLRELQSAIAEKSASVPDSYRAFLMK
ncbi:MAG: PAS domain S-box protein, partial [Methanolinea sp.]|nr:PAS domain S-box protein [Methanolinea sp.]